MNRIAVLLSCLMVSAVTGTAIANEEKPMSVSGSVDSAETETLDESLAKNLDEASSYWFYLGCVYRPLDCRFRARYHGFNYWAAAQQPWNCGYYAWACYGSYYYP